jgi:hypothetical protein
MKDFVGTIKGADLAIAMKRGKEIKPTVKNIYIRVCDLNLEFVVRKRVNGLVEEHIVHTVVISPDDIADHGALPDFHGFPICISVKLTEMSVKMAKERGQDRLPDTNCSHMGGFGFGVSCSMSGD